MMRPKTPPERYADLSDLADLSGVAGGSDPALARLVTHLDQALHARPVPPQVQTGLDQLLRQRIAAPPAPIAVPSRTLRPAGVISRRAALRAAAAGFAALLSLSHITPALADELTRLAGQEPMTGPRLAGLLRAERARWNGLLAQVGLDRMEAPGVEGAWSVKQLVAHLTWYEQAVVLGAQQALSTGTFTRRRPEGVGLDEMNAQIAEQSRARPVSEVLAEADTVVGQLLTLIEACPQDILNDPHLLGLPDDLAPWMGVANNSYGHYREHEPAIRAWLERA